MNDTQQDRESRRAFCTRAAALTCFGGTLASILEGCSSPTSPSGGASALPTVSGARTASGITVTIDAASPLATSGGAALVQASGTNYLVANAGSNSFVALSAICTHETCVISGFSSGTYVCPCHGSTFDLNGRVLAGPAPTALRQYPAQFSNGVLTISA